MEDNKVKTWNDIELICENLFAYIKRDALLSDKKPLDGARYKIIESRVIAIEMLAYEHEPRWEDILTEYCPSPEIPYFASSKLNNLIATEVISEKIPEEYHSIGPSKYFIQDVLGTEVLYVAYSLIHYQGEIKLPKLWSYIFHAITSGYLPCGWEGDFETGKLIVYA